MVEMLEALTIQTWRTVTLGVHKTRDEYHQALKVAKHLLDDWVNDNILDNAVLTCATEENDMDLMVLSVVELGFENGAKYTEICARALQMGLGLCPAEVGPALRLAYRDQPRGEWLIIAMNDLSSSDDVFIVSVEHDHNGQWISGYRGSPDGFWQSDYRFVFVRHK